MRKKVIIGLCILAALILLCPFSIGYLDDGGTVVYDAVLYSFHDVHSLGRGPNGTIAEGLIVEVLGFTIFDNVNWADLQR